VLVIEDHPTNQAMMAWRLQQLGVPHVLVGDGQQGLDRLASESFDLVITDCRMPVLDGFGFTRLLREREGRTGQPRLTVLALTASVLDDDARRCREAGMDEVLAKPLSLATLRAALLRWLPQAQGQSFEEPVRSPPTTACAARSGHPAAALRLAAVAEQLRDSLLQASEGDLAAVQRALQAGDREAAALHLHRQAGGSGRWGDGTGRAGQCAGRAPAGCGRDRSGAVVRRGGGVRGAAAATAAAPGSLSRLLLQVGDHQRAAFGAGEGVVHARARHQVGGRLQEGIQGLRGPGDVGAAHAVGIAVVGQAAGAAADHAVQVRAEAVDAARLHGVAAGTQFERALHGLLVRLFGRGRRCRRALAGRGARATATA
jgi:CheY-like chemotaxis protein